MLSEKFKSQHNDTILPLQYCKLLRDSNRMHEEWMDQLGIKPNECNYQEHDRWLKGQFIDGINNKAMTSEIIKELIVNI